MPKNKVLVLLWTSVQSIEIAEYDDDGSVETVEEYESDIGYYANDHEYDKDNFYYDGNTNQLTFAEQEKKEEPEIFELGLEDQGTILIDQRTEHIVTKVNRSLWRMQEGDLIENYKGANLTLIIGQQGVANKLVFNALTGYMQTPRDIWRPWYGHVNCKTNPITMFHDLVVAPARIDRYRNQSWEISFSYWLEKAVQTSFLIRIVLVVPFDIINDHNKVGSFHNTLYSFVEVMENPSLYKGSTMLIVVVNEQKLCKEAPGDMERIFGNMFYIIQQKAIEAGQIHSEKKIWGRALEFLLHFFEFKDEGDKERVVFNSNVIIVAKKQNGQKNAMSLGRNTAVEKYTGTNAPKKPSSVVEAITQLPFAQIYPGDFDMKLKPKTLITIDIITKRNLVLYTQQITSLCNQMAANIESYEEYTTANFGTEASEILRDAYFDLIDIVSEMDNTKYPGEIMQGFSKMVIVIGAATSLKSEPIKDALATSRVLHISYVIKPRITPTEIYDEWRRQFTILAGVIKQAMIFEELLENLYTAFSVYEIQAHRERYDVTNIEDWGKPKEEQKSPGQLIITEANFATFVKLFGNITNTENAESIRYKPKRAARLNELIAQTIRGPVEYVCDTTDMLIKGDYLVFSKINWNYCSNTRPRGDTESSIRLYAFVTVFIDITLDMSERMLLMFIIAPKWYVHSSPRLINLNGYDGYPKSPASMDVHGEQGYKGGTAGCFQGLAEEIENAHLLSISVKGGKGGTGQKGGKGVPGQNATIFQFTGGYDTQNETSILNLIEFNTIPNAIFFGKRVRSYIRFRTGEEKYEKLPQHRRWRKTEGWFIAVTGALGLKGGPGRNGGKGGAGGYQGSIEITCIVGCNLKKIIAPGEVGIYGDGGEGGDGGFHEPDFRLRLTKRMSFLHSSNKAYRVETHWSVPIYKSPKGQAATGDPGAPNASNKNQTMPIPSVCFGNSRNPSTKSPIEIVKEYQKLLELQVLGNLHRNRTSFNFLNYIKNKYILIIEAQAKTFRRSTEKTLNITTAVGQFLIYENKFIDEYPNKIEEIKSALSTEIPETIDGLEWQWLRIAIVSKICALQQFNSHFVMESRILARRDPLIKAARELKPFGLLGYRRTKQKELITQIHNSRHVNKEPEDYVLQRKPMLNIIKKLFIEGAKDPLAYLVLPDKLTSWSIYFCFQITHTFLEFLLQLSDFLFDYIANVKTMTAKRVQVINTGTNLINELRIERRKQIGAVQNLLQTHVPELSKEVREELIEVLLKYLSNTSEEISNWDRLENTIFHLLDYEDGTENDDIVLRKLARDIYVISISNEIYELVKPDVDKLHLNAESMFNVRFVHEQFDHLIEYTIKCILESPEFLATQDRIDPPSKLNKLRIANWALDSSLNHLIDLIQSAGTYSTETRRRTDQGRNLLSGQLLFLANRFQYVFSQFEVLVWLQMLYECTQTTQANTPLAARLQNIAKNNLYLVTYFMMYRHIQFQQFPYSDKPQILEKILHKIDQPAAETEKYVIAAVEKLRVPFIEKLSVVNKFHPRDIFVFGEEYSYLLERLLRAKPVFMRPNLLQSEYAVKGHAHRCAIDAASIKFIVDVESAPDFYETTQMRILRERLNRWLRGVNVKLTHMGDSKYRCGGSYFEVHIPPTSYTYLYKSIEFDKKSAQIKEEIERAKPKPPVCDADDEPCEYQKDKPTESKLPEEIEKRKALIEQCEFNITELEEERAELQAQLDEYPSYEDDRRTYHKKTHRKQFRSMEYDPLRLFPYQNKNYYNSKDRFDDLLNNYDEYTESMTSLTPLPKPNAYGNPQIPLNPAYSWTHTTIRPAMPNMHISQLLSEREGIKAELEGVTTEIDKCKANIKKWEDEIKNLEGPDGTYELEGSAGDGDAKEMVDQETEGLAKYWIKKSSPIATWLVHIPKKFTHDENELKKFIKFIRVKIRAHFVYIPDKFSAACDKAANHYRTANPPTEIKDNKKKENKKNE